MRELAETAADAGLDHLQFENLAVASEYGHSIDEAHAIETELVRYRCAVAAVPGPRASVVADARHTQLPTHSPGWTRSG